MIDEHKILDLRFNGLNPAGRLPDRSGYAFDFSVFGWAGNASEFVDGRYGQALNLVPNKNFGYTLQVDDVLDFLYGFSIEAWIRRTGAFGVLGTLSGCATGANVDKFYLQFTAANLITFVVENGGGFTALNSIQSIIDTRVHHIVVTADATTLRISIDGAEDNNGPHNRFPLRSCIGGVFSVNIRPFSAAHGTIEYEAFRVYNRVLGTTEIMKNKRLGPNRT